MESLHPAVVHLPIGLIVAALLIETLALFLNRPQWRRISLWNLSLGAIGAAAAVLTGRQAMAAAKHSLEIHRVMELHEKLGYGILALLLILAGWRLAARDRLSPWARWTAWGLLAAACGVIAFSAHLGGRMVYEFGVGGSYGRSGGIEVVQ
ncbi:MAG: DUF2231 domain-containing protein [Candidatus Omnitrophica bacterium]|nr:DUF2231 domain-containing protein [Candidatus Omnitrophota bacterium]